MKLWILMLLIFVIGYSLFTPQTLLGRRMEAWVFAPFSPGWGCCYRCKRTWNIAESHNTMYSDFRGCFPLCQRCWKDLTPLQRLPFYKEILADWEKESPADSTQKAAIIKAVLEGK